MPSQSRKPLQRPASNLDILNPSYDQQGPSHGNQAAAQDLPAQGGGSGGGLLDSLMSVFGGHDKAPAGPTGQPTGKAGPQGGGAEAWAQVVGGTLTLRLGSKGPAVQQLQTLLNQNGSSLTADGDFGKGTRRAVIAFQTANGLGADGVVGRGTAQAFGGSPAPAAPTRENGPTREVADTEHEAPAKKPKAPGGQKWVEGEPPVINVRPGDFVREGLTQEVLTVALTVFKNAWMAGKTKKMLYTVIDYSRPRRDKRLFVLDLEAGKMLFAEHVQDGAGKNAGADPLAHSNERGSGESSVGLSRTGAVGEGEKYGKNLALHGLEPGFNDNMARRQVIMHGWGKKSSEAFEEDGSVYLSEGCPAMDPRVAGKVIETIKGGTLVFSYFPDEKYLRESKFTH
ncbi:MAG: murein L,D-transpeptidase catalytic domain family protein [Deltaproteobacteria bacterium]|nr:murein L,D-transpeptidase catalytic domain family protein [Deltaproteobacteria bacterium]